MHSIKYSDKGHKSIEFKDTFHNLYEVRDSTSGGLHIGLLGKSVLLNKKDIWVLLKVLLGFLIKGRL